MSDDMSTPDVTADDARSVQRRIVEYAQSLADTDQPVANPLGLPGKAVYVNLPVGTYTLHLSVSFSPQVWYVEDGDYECSYCHTYTDVPSCTASNNGWGCTRDSGHDGQHVACGTDADDHPIHTWEQGSTS